MAKLKPILIIFAVILANACSEKTASKSITTDSLSGINNNCEIGTPINEKVYIDAQETPMRTGPGDEFDRVVNQKATKILKKTHYRDLTPSYVLQGTCETIDWIQGKIVEVEGSPKSWELGWVARSATSSKLTGDPAIGLYWDVNSENEFSSEEKIIVRNGALNVLKNEPDCKSIATGYRSGSRTGAYYVTCDTKSGIPFNVWFTPEDISSGRPLKRP